MLNIAIIQAELHWEQRKANLEMFGHHLKNLSSQVDLVIMPETFDTGFTMKVQENADRAGETLKWMKEMSEKYEVSLAGSCIVYEGNKYYNRLFVVFPDGKYEKYDKRHLFRMGREDRYFSSGKERMIVKIGDLRFLLQICYDLRFPVFARNRGDYDVIIYVANWPTPRKSVWEKLLPARAIENQAYVLAANRTGIDGEGVGNCGQSCIIDPKGNTIAALDDSPGILYATINKYDLEEFREKFPVYKDSDNFSLEL